MIDALVANETGQTPNPGCRAVRRGIDRLCALSDVRHSASLPIGFWAKDFEVLKPAKEHRLVVGEGTFAQGKPEPAPLDLDAWFEISRGLAEGDDTFSKLLDQTDLLIVNGEGSIHHNLPRALALCALMRMATESGKRVALTNASLQGMSQELLQAVLPDIGFCQVRERQSLAEVLPSMPSAFCAPDLAVQSIKTIARPFRTAEQMDGADCMICGGVLVNENMLRDMLNAAVECGLRPWYLLIGDGGERQLVTKYCWEEGIPIIDAGLLTLERLVGVLSSAAMAVSGRHHINLFLMRCGVPFVPIPSNTWKVEGTLKLAGYARNVVSRPEDLSKSIAEVYEDRRFLSQSALESFDRCVALSNETIDRFRQWSC